MNQCAQLRAGRNNSAGIQGEQSPEVIVAPGFGITGVVHSRKRVEALPPTPKIGVLPKGAAAATEQRGVDELPADQGGEQANIRQGELIAAEPGAPILKGLLRLFKRTEEICFGAVLGRLCSGEPAAVHPVIDGRLQQ